MSSVPAADWMKLPVTVSVPVRSAPPPSGRIVPALASAPPVASTVPLPVIVPLLVKPLDLLKTALFAMETVPLCEKVLFKSSVPPLTLTTPLTALSKATPMEACVEVVLFSVPVLLKTLVPPKRRGLV